jgi:hypothetical protein
MKNFGRALERRRVRYLLISGQATVLYGASMFSEDFDLWVQPTEGNWQRFLDALEDRSALVYKLTPSLAMSYAIRGHGFHFLLPVPAASRAPIYLDVMAAPPRVTSFDECARRKRWFVTDWGRVPVIGVRDLVELKKTRRLADYEVISALVRNASRMRQTREAWFWALSQTFEAEDMIAIWNRGKPAWRSGALPDRAAVRMLAKERSTQRSRRRLALALAKEIESWRERDRQYWQPIMAELKSLQREGRLLKEGSSVADVR